MTDNIYIEKVYAAVDYIREHPDQKISLDKISDIAGLSKYHLHRIFHAFTGESLYEAVIRISLESAAGKLLDSPSMKISAIAESFGFEDSASFSKAFKERFAISPSAWRKNPDRTGVGPAYPAIRSINKDNNLPDAILTETRKLNGFSIAYVRHSEAYAGDSSLFIYLYNKLTAWAASESVLTPECENIVVYHDPLEITDDTRLKISLGISVPESTETGGDIGKMKLQGGDYLVCRYKLRDDQYGKAWNEVYRKHLPELGLQPTDGYCFELYPNKVENPDKYSTIVDICVPVEKLDF